MVKEIRYTNIKTVLSNLLDHPMLSDVSLEQAVRYVIRFIGLHGYSHLYEDKIEEVDIHEFRGLLPCDLVSIIQVKDIPSGICLRSMTDNFTPGLAPVPPAPPHPMPDKNGEMPEGIPGYIPPRHLHAGELAFKTQGRVIFASFPEGHVQVAYKSIPVDEDGFPLLIDNETYLAALEAYIKKQVFTIKYDQGKIAAGVLQNAQTDYAYLAGELSSEFTSPSVSEMQSISNMVNSLIPRMHEFYNGFKTQGNKQWIRRH